MSISIVVCWGTWDPGIGDKDSIASGRSSVPLSEDEKLMPIEIVRKSKIPKRSNINL